MAEDFRLFTSGLFGFSLFTKDIPFAVNSMTSSLQIMGADGPEYYETVMGMQDPEEFYSKGNHGRSDKPQIEWLDFGIFESYDMFTWTGYWEYYKDLWRVRIMYIFAPWLAFSYYAYRILTGDY